MNEYAPETINRLILLQRQKQLRENITMKIMQVTGSYKASESL